MFQIERAHTEPLLQTMPSKDVQKMPIVHSVKQYDAEAEKDTEVSAVISAVIELQSQDVALISFFRDFDRAATGTISPHQFR